MCYTQVSAGGYHSVLLQSDGNAVACGLNRHGQCNSPPVETSGGCYLFEFGKDYILQVDITFKDDAVVLTCLDLAGRSCAFSGSLTWTTGDAPTHCT